MGPHVTVYSPRCPRSSSFHVVWSVTLICCSFTAGCRTVLISRVAFAWIALPVRSTRTRYLTLHRTARAIRTTLVTHALDYTLRLRYTWFVHYLYRTCVPLTALPVLHKFYVDLLLITVPHARTTDLPALLSRVWMRIRCLVSRLDVRTVPADRGYHVYDLHVALRVLTHVLRSFTIRIYLRFGGGLFLPAFVPLLIRTYYTTVGVPPHVRHLTPVDSACCHSVYLHTHTFPYTAFRLRLPLLRYRLVYVAHRWCYRRSSRWIYVYPALPVHVLDLRLPFVTRFTVHATRVARLPHTISWLRSSLPDFIHRFFLDLLVTLLILRTVYVD